MRPLFWNWRRRTRTERTEGVRAAPRWNTSRSREEVKPSAPEGTGVPETDEIRLPRESKAQNNRCVSRGLLQEMSSGNEVFHSTPDQSATIVYYFDLFCLHTGAGRYNADRVRVYAFFPRSLPFILP